MSYYSKKEVIEYIETNNEAILSSGWKPLTPLEESLLKLTNNEDIVGFLWVELIKIEDGAHSIRPKMQGKLFVKIDEDIYSDDRYAADEYQAKKEGKTVGQIIKERREETEKAKQGIQNDGA
jgi:hypothetical protein